MLGAGISVGGETGGGGRWSSSRRKRRRQTERERGGGKFIMYNKTKGVLGNNSDIKIRLRWVSSIYEKMQIYKMQMSEMME